MHEIESKLVVLSDDPEALFARLAGLEELAGHPLTGGEPRWMEDSYLDLPQGTLRAAGYGLRLRRFGTPPRAPRMTLKGPAQREGQHATRRFELEGELGQATLVAIFEALAERGLWRGPAPTPDASTEPDELAAALGLRVVHRRFTRRTPIEAADPHSGGAVAELTLDAVGYRFDQRVVVHHEVEIEAAGEGGGELVNQLTEALRSAVGGELEPWTCDKTALGEVLGQLEAAGELSDLLGADGSPTAELYRVVRGRFE